MRVVRTPVKNRPSNRRSRRMRARSHCRWSSPAMESDSGERVFMLHDTSWVMTINSLDNPVWHALTGPHCVNAIGHGAARHYPRDMAPFSAITEPSPEAYADLAVDLPPGTEARLFRPSEEPLVPG